jgi:hypothetical protein
MPHSDLMRKYFPAYDNKDCKAVESLLTDGFVFTSPYDDHIDGDTHFKRCWPYSENPQFVPLRRFLRKAEKPSSTACSTGPIRGPSILYETVPKRTV